MSYPPRSTRITYEGLSFLSILVFIILGSILRQINLLVLLSGLMIAPLFFNWRISRKMLERVKFRRRLPEWAHAGKPFVVEWQAENHRSRVSSWGIKISDQIRAQGAGKREIEKIDLILPQINPQDSATTSYRCLLSSRGVYEFGPAIASVAFPIGLFRSRVRLAEPDWLTVAPRLGTLLPRWRQLTQSSAVGVRSNFKRRGLSDDEFFAIRQWKPGDPRRIIHWRSTAKHGELLVKQFEERTDHDFGIVLDLFADERTNPELIELSISFMATVVSQMNQIVKGDTVVGLFGDSNWIAEQRVTRRLQGEVMKRLATIGATAHTGVARHLKQVFQSTSRDTSVIVISTRSFADLAGHGKGHPEESAGQQLAAFRRNLDWIDMSNNADQNYFQIEAETNPAQLTKIAAPH